MSAATSTPERPPKRPSNVRFAQTSSCSKTRRPNRDKAGPWICNNISKIVSRGQENMDLRGFACGRRQASFLRGGAAFPAPLK